MRRERALVEASKKSKSLNRSVSRVWNQILNVTERRPVNSSLLE